MSYGFVCPRPLPNSISFFCQLSICTPSFLPYALTTFTFSLNCPFQYGTKQTEREKKRMENISYCDQFFNVPSQRLLFMNNFCHIIVKLIILLLLVFTWSHTPLVGYLSFSSFFLIFFKNIIVWGVIKKCYIYS